MGMVEIIMRSVIIRIEIEITMIEEKSIIKRIHKISKRRVNKIMLINSRQFKSNKINFMINNNKDRLELIISLDIMIITIEIKIMITIEIGIMIIVIEIMRT